jgi:hydrogenase maturation protease
MSRILIAGIGNVLLGDDGFGAEVVRRLAKKGLPGEVRLMDCGNRAFDLAFEMLHPHDAVLLVDLVQRGGAPGTLYLMKIDAEDNARSESGEMCSGHAIDVAQVLRLISAYERPTPRRLFLLGCEPEYLADESDLCDRLSEPVRAAVDEAVTRIEVLVHDLLKDAACMNCPSP